MNGKAELEEIGHTGGKVTFDIKINDHGDVSYSVGWSHCRPTAAAMFAVYAIPQGIAVADIQMGGIGTPWNPPPIPDCLPVFISSDSTGMFGHQCPNCNGYWRASHGSKLCPYCAFQAAEQYHFLTEAQQSYVKEYCSLLRDALYSGQSVKHLIDMDAVAEARVLRVQVWIGGRLDVGDRPVDHVSDGADLARLGVFYGQGLDDFLLALEGAD